MGVGAERRFAHPPAEGEEVGRAAQVGAQREGVGEKADQLSSSERWRLAIRVPTTTSSWPAKRPSRVAKAASSTMKGVKPPALAKRRSSCHSSASSANSRLSPAKVWSAGRGASVGRVSSGGAPARCCRHQARPLSSLSPFSAPALPGGDVGVLHGERRQRVGQAGGEGAVVLPELADQDAERPAVGHQVVDGDQQNVLLRAQPQQGGAQQRVALQIVAGIGGRPRPRSATAASASAAGRSPRSTTGRWWRSGGSTTWQRLAVHLDEAGAQGLVAGDDALEPGAERWQVERAASRKAPAST